MTYRVVEISKPHDPLLETPNLREAMSHCLRHPERGILRGRRTPRFVPIHHPHFDPSEW